jgi:hypothetical protein
MEYSPYYDRLYYNTFFPSLTSSPTSVLAPIQNMVESINLGVPQDTSIADDKDDKDDKDDLEEFDAASAADTVAGWVWGKLHATKFVAKHIISSIED